ncbi:MAG TPA: endonuclease/exonuclease/phosphatase family protein [Pyrinomonadaceae bacterium]|jgi:endonuclease/exonuclease/phosphatase family metal-dependent hydrolase|nr:endonuclease/exonuclease/phosphatase family protein [Pyrinomonadaceae bacterium]
MIELSEESVTEGAGLPLEIESFAPPIDPHAERSGLVIVSYNIRYAVGSFLITGSLLRRAGIRLPARRPNLVARHLRRAARAFSDGKRLPRPDIVALQEADRQTARAGGHHVARELARALRMQYVHASACVPRDEEQKAKQWYLDFEEHIAREDPGDTGVALLSRFPLRSAARVELPWTACAWRPRLALEAVVPVGRTDINIFNTHIDPHASTEEQLAQHEAVLASAAEKSGPTILLGDFNTLTRAACARMREFIEAHGYKTPMPTRLATWRAGLIRLHTDWIFVRGARISRWGVARPLGVSDHWPVWVEILLG